METLEPSAEVTKAIKPMKDIFIKEALTQSEKTYGPLSDREMLMIAHCIGVTIATCIETNRLIYREFKENPTMVEHWDKVDEFARNNEIR